MNDLIFIPIFKSKASAEPKAVDQCKALFSQRVLPFIEIIDEKKGKGYKKISSVLSDTIHFEQYYRKDDNLSEIINLTMESGTKHVIPCLQIKSSLEIDLFKDEILQLIRTAHIHKSSCSLRIPAGVFNDNLKAVLHTLSQSDFLFIDIGCGEYGSASYYVEYIKSVAKQTKVIVLSNERPQNLTGSLMEQNGFNRGFNTSVIDSIKNNSFGVDGFSSFCSARDDLNQVALPLNVYATFIIYNFKHNGFFSIKTPDYDIVARIYKELKDVVISRGNVINDLFRSTPISKYMLDEFLNSDKKGNASTYIGISIVHYVEEIVYNLNLLNI